MELREKVKIISSWECSPRLQSVFYITNQSGIVLDEPVQSEQCGNVLLTEPVETDEEGCLVHLTHLALLSGYRVVGVELQSVARTVELYSGRARDYVGTSRGEVLEESVEGCQQYLCKLDCPTDSCVSSDFLSLKLLSLKGRTTVPVTRLNLKVIEDHGGLAAGDTHESPIAAKQEDLGQLVSALNLRAGAPPFIQSLLSSLQHLQSFTPNATTTPASSHSTPSRPAARAAKEGEGPSMNITEMMAAFRQLRPAPKEQQAPPSLADTSTENKNQNCDNEETADTKESRDLAAVSLSSIEAMIDRKIASLEARLKDYIDSQVKAAMTTHFANFEQNGTKENRMMVGQMKNTDNNSSQNGNGTQNGLLNFEDQLD